MKAVRNECIILLKWHWAEILLTCFVLKALSETIFVCGVKQIYERKCGWNITFSVQMHASFCPKYTLFDRNVLLYWYFLTQTAYRYSSHYWFWSLTHLQISVNCALTNKAESMLWCIWKPWQMMYKCWQVVYKMRWRNKNNKKITGKQDQLHYDKFKLAYNF